jgi:IstB-like ATP binding protein
MGPGGLSPGPAVRVRCVTAASLVSTLEEAEPQDTRDRFLGPLDRAERRIGAERGDVSLSRNGVERRFRLRTDRSERSRVRITSPLAFADGAPVFPGERRTAARRARITHRGPIVERNGESDRFGESRKAPNGQTTG